MNKCRLLICLAILILLGCGKKPRSRPWQISIQEKNLSAAQFTDNVAVAIHEGIPSAKATVDETLVLTVRIGGTESLCNLENAWRDCAAEPAGRVDVVTRHVDALRSAFSSTNQDSISLEEIVPVIKDKTWLDETARQGMQIYHEQLAADLFVTYAADGPSQLRFIDQKEFMSFGLSAAKMRINALSNLASRLPKIERLGEGPLYMLTAGGTFESSLLLLANIWKEQEKAVDGRIVVAVPSRELILFTGENAHEAVQQMRSTVADIQTDGNYLISATILLRDNDRWVPLFKN